MPIDRIRDIDLYWERAGDGPPLLFIGGSGGDLRQKPNVLDGPFPRHFDVVAFDQRGLGRTSHPDTPYTMADYAHDAAGLLDTIGWDRCNVVGVSFGGMVAQELAVTFPDRIRKLVLCCTSSGGEGGASYPLHELERMPAEERAVRSLEIGDTRHDAAWRAAHPDVAANLIQLQHDMQALGAHEPDRMMGYRRQLEARRDHDTWSRLPALTMPVLVCGGRFDGIAPPANQQALERQIPNATLEMFDGGHVFMMQDRSAFPRMIEFLEAEA